MPDNFLKELNPSQQAAVTYNEGPAIILAGAGSGKTRVLAYKTMYLLEQKGVPPENVLMLTFTNKAASEMKTRIISYIDPTRHPERITATTFHSFAASLLRRYGVLKSGSRNFAIFDDMDQKEVLKDVIKKINLKLHLTPASLLYKISLFKNQLLTPKEVIDNSTNFYDEMIAEAYKEYQKGLRENNALDFDDLLNEAVYLLHGKPHLLKTLQDLYQHILIDEYQDTNHAQYMLAKLLSAAHRQITIVGDFAQSIYSWRGADFRNLEKFQDDYPDAKVFNLEQNYRSTQPILDFAYNVISQNTTHPILKLWTDKKNGDEVEIVQRPSAEEEAFYVLGKIQELNLNGDYDLDDCAILYRTNAQSRIFEEVCLHQGLPYKIYGGVRFYERKEIKDLLACLRFIDNPDDKVSLKRLEKLGKRRAKAMMNVLVKQKPEEKPQILIQNILKNSPYLELYSDTDPEDVARLENIQELVNVSVNYETLRAFLDTVALIEAGYEFGDENRSKIHLMTMHAAKGLEFSVVFVVGVEEGIVPHSRSVNSQAELEEERRLFYVALTRAKQRLFLTYTERRLIYGRLEYHLPSQFLGRETSVEF